MSENFTAVHSGLLIAWSTLEAFCVICIGWENETRSRWNKL